MKVLMILTTKFEISGITSSVMNYYRYIDKSDMQIDFVVPNKLVDRLRNEIEKNGGQIFELLNRNSNPILYMKNLKKIIKRGDYEIVHAHGNSCTLSVEMLAAKSEGVKVRISHSHNTACEHKIFNKILRPLFDKTYTHGFACGTDAGKWLFKDEAFTVITNGNDIDKFAFNEDIRKEYRARYKIEEKIAIGHVGLFNYQKNHEFLIDVFNEIKLIDDNYVLILVGDGELKYKIEQKVKELKLDDSVIFTGQSLEVEKLIQAMDIMVFPSRHEGLPGVVVEWQIAGLPALISDRITREVKLTDLVEFRSLEDGAKAWAEKIIKMDIADRNLIRKNVISQITDAGFNVQENAKELKKIYKKLCNQN